MQQWSVIEGESQTQGAEGVRTYGVQTTLPSGDVWQWEDVDLDFAVVEVLAHRLQEIQPEQCHFEEIVLDFIEEMAAKV